MANNYFQKRIMASEQNYAYLRSIKYYVSATPTTITNGALVTLSDPLVSIWGNHDKSTYQAIMPAADTDPVYIVDLLETPAASLGTNYYRVGAELSNLTALADAVVRVRKPKIDDIFELGADNFASTPTVGQFAITTAGALTHTPSAGIVTTKYCVKIEEAITVGFGVSKSITAYVCRVVTAI
jgi:hypothetical protein